MKIGHLALYCKDLEGMKGFFEKYFQATSNNMYHNPQTNLRTTGDGYYESCVKESEGILLEITV